MLRTAITIISLLLSVVIPSLGMARDIEVTKSEMTGDDYILYVKDIPLPDSVKIYGQPTFMSNNQYYGGRNEDYFNQAYTPVNSSIEGLTFGRDENGIFFKMPASSDVGSVGITLVEAYNAGGTDGWCPKNGPNDNISVTWRFKETSEYNSNLTTGFIGSDTAIDDEEEIASSTPSPWHISNIDCVLFAFIVIIALVVLFRNKKPKEKPDDKAQAAEDLKFEIDDLKKQIAGLTTSGNNCTKAISDLVCRCNTLESDMRKLQKKDKQDNTDTKGDNTKTITPMLPARPVDLGKAEVVAEEKVLVINSSGAAFFQLTRNIDGQVTFTLIDNPEVRNFFETNSSMLEIYKNDGIISYDAIPGNSHVYVESAGIAKETDQGKYEVVTPLKLIFK